MLKLNVGCGKDYKPGYVNLDQHFSDGADKLYIMPRLIVRNERGKYKVVVEGSQLPYNDDSVDEIYCSHVLEDFLYEFEIIMQDFCRVLKPGGVLHIKVPFGVSFGSYHHKRSFDENTFKGFLLNDYCYEDKKMFSEIKLCRVNRYGLLTTLSMFFFSKLPFDYSENLYKKAYRRSKSKKNNFFKFLFWVFRNELRIGRRYEVEVVMVK